MTSTNMPWFIKIQDENAKAYVFILYLFTIHTNVLVKFSIYYSIFKYINFSDTLMMSMYRDNLIVDIDIIKW